VSNKLFLGHKLRSLREQHGLTQTALATRLGLSISYLSQLENNQRAITVQVLIALNREFGIDIAQFTDDDHGQPGYATPMPGLQEIKHIAETAPTFLRRFLEQHQALTQRRAVARDWQLDKAGRSGDSLDSNGASAIDPQPYETARDFFHYRNNYIDALDRAAEALATTMGLNGDGGDPSPRLTRFLEQAHRVRLRFAGESGEAEPASHNEVLRHYDPAARILTLNGSLSGPTRNFMLACQTAMLSLGGSIDRILGESGLKSADARAICRAGLVNYAAGALIMPYAAFAARAARLRHDIERLQRHFHTSFEQVCHRLSTLQRPGKRGVPFYFLRVDLAGNITKRHSATRFQFARFGGACPLWNVHEAFGMPGRIMVQQAEMPDGSRYICIARSIIKRGGAYRQPNRHFAVGFGCEISHAPALVYTDGLSLDDAAAYDPVGISCRLCPRERCQQRAAPPLSRAITINPDVRAVLPYVVGSAGGGGGD
jgi:predicted transcriptional regulator/transcriptional regulator with XRE-family HTH domain